MEWLEHLILSEGGGLVVEELLWHLSESGFRPRQSQGHALHLDYIYVDGQAVLYSDRTRGYLCRAGILRRVQAAILDSV